MLLAASRLSLAKAASDCSARAHLSSVVESEARHSASSNGRHVITQVYLVTKREDRNGEDGFELGCRNRLCFTHSTLICLLSRRDYAHSHSQLSIDDELEEPQHLSPKYRVSSRERNVTCACMPERLRASVHYLLTLYVLYRIRNSLANNG